MRRASLALLLFFSGTAAFAAIQGASNISGEKVVVSVRDDKSPRHALVVLNLKTGNKEALSLPKELGSEEIMGMMLFPDQLVMISQWTAGDGKNPHLHEYSFKNKSWGKPSEIACVSFDTIEIKASDIKFQCEEGGELKSSLSFKVSAPLKVVLPLQSYKQGTLQYKLSGGSMFVWKSIEFQDGTKPKRSFSVKDLLQ